jgi:prevent-host-death family protein
MKKVSMQDLKKDLSSITAEAGKGTEILITRHNRPVARLTRPVADHLHHGPRFGSASLKPALSGKTAGRYLEFLNDDRRSGRE